MRPQLALLLLCVSAATCSVLGKRKSCSFTDSTATCVYKDSQTCTGEKPSCHNHVFWYTCYCHEDESEVACGRTCWILKSKQCFNLINTCSFIFVFCFFSHWLRTSLVGQFVDPELFCQEDQILFVEVYICMPFALSRTVHQEEISDTVKPWMWLHPW